MGKKEKFRNYLSEKEIPAQIILVIALLVSSCIMFHSYLFGEDLMIFDDIGSDTWQQYSMHYGSIINHLRSGNFSFWDFTNGFGTSFFSLNLFDPTLILLYILGTIFGHARMLLCINYVQVLRILAAGWMFYRFMMKFSFSRQARFAAAYIYGLNGYLLVWGQHYQFGIVTIYLPMLLLFAEKFLRREKGGILFPAAVCLSAMDSVYFSYMSLIGTGFYLLFRVWMIDGWNWKARIGRFLAGCGRILMGIAMSAVTFLPTVYVLTNVSSRISEEGKGILAWLHSLFSVYSRDYYSTLALRIFSSHFEDSHFFMDGGGFQNYYEAPVLFCCTLTVFLAVQFLAVFWRSAYSRRCKAAVYTAAALMVFCVLMPWGGTVFNAFVMPTNRYTFVLIPFLLLASVWMWDYLKTGGKVNLFALVLVEILLVYAAYTGYQYGELKVYRNNAIILGVSGSVMALCLLFLAYAKKKLVCRMMTGVLGIAIVLNVMSEGAAAYTDRVNLRKEDTPPKEMQALAEEYQKLADTYGDRKVREMMDRPQDFFNVTYPVDIPEILKYIKETDPEFCRVEKDYCSGTVAMDSLVQGYRGISTYNSVMNKNIREFVSVCYPEMNDPNEAHYVFWKNADDNWFAAFTGVRYLISREPDLDASRYELIKPFQHLYLYKNVLDSDVARFYDTAISEESLKKLCNADTRQELLDQAIAIEGGTEIEDLSEFRELMEEHDRSVPGALTDTDRSSGAEASSVILDNTDNDSHLTGKIQAASDGYVLFTIPYEGGWSLMIDGKETEMFRGDLGFLACEVSQGEHEMELTYRAPLLYEGLLISLAAWIIYGIWAIRSSKKYKK